MKPSANRLLFYLKIYFLLVKYSILDILIFRVNALIIGLGPVAWMATVLIFLATIFSKVQTLGGWDFWQVVFLTGVHETIFLLTWMTFLGNLRTFIADVRWGRFDQNLLKPINPRFLISFRWLDFTAIGSLANVVVILSFSLGKIIPEVEAVRWFGFVVLIGMSYFICYLTYFIFASLALFFINSRTFIDWIFDATDFDRYPAEIYPLSLRVFLTFFIPILFFAYVPTAYLLGKLDWIYLIFGLILIVILFLISEYVWRIGLRHYQSASS